CPCPRHCRSAESRHSHRTRRGGPHGPERFRRPGPARGAPQRRRRAGVHLPLPDPGAGDPLAARAPRRDRRGADRHRQDRRVRTTAAGRGRAVRARGPRSGAGSYPLAGHAGGRGHLLVRGLRGRARRDRRLRRLPVRPAGAGAVPRCPGRGGHSGPRDGPHAPCHPAARHGAFRRARRGRRDAADGLRRGGGGDPAPPPCRWSAGPVPRDQAAADPAVATEHMKDPVRVSVSPQSSTVSSVKQSYAVVPFRHRTGALARVLATTEAKAAIVFVRTRAAAEEVGAALIERGLIAASISGDVAQKDRERIVGRLRDGSLQVLVATDVAARGLDVDRIGLVVNFDVPREPEAYVHRIGRTGRAGRSGEAITFIGPHERRALKNIERATKQTLAEAEVPSPRDVSRHRLRTVLAQVPERAQRGRLELYRELIAEFLAEGTMEASELAAVLAAMTVGDDGPGARPEDEEFTGATLAGGQGARGGGPKPEHGYTSYRIGVGHSHGARPPSIVGAITGEGGLDGKDVGKISIFGNFALVQIRGELTE